MEKGVFLAIGGFNLLSNKGRQNAMEYVAKLEAIQARLEVAKKFWQEKIAVAEKMMQADDQKKSLLNPLKKDWEKRVEDIDDFIFGEAENENEPDQTPSNGEMLQEERLANANQCSTSEVEH